MSTTRLKCISLWQPWATAVAMGVKKFETRSWKASHRGLIGIHAARRFGSLQRMFWDEHWQDVYPTIDDYPEKGKALPIGGIVGVGELVECIPTSILDPHVSNQERRWGNFAPGRFAWRFYNVLPLAEPFHCPGRQGFFFVNVPDNCLPMKSARGQAQSKTEGVS